MTDHGLWRLVLAVSRQFADAALQSMPVLLIAAAIFSVLGLVGFACNAGPRWWRKPDLVTDLCYVVILPGLMHYGRLLLLIAGTVMVCGADAGRMAHFFDTGHGPLGRLPFWGQIVAYLLIGDLLLYVTHRLFHTASLWKYHAVHHSSEQLEWISAQRFHPVDLLFHSVIADVALLLLGVSPDVLIWLAPFTVGNSVLVHANLNWSYGPLRYVVTSPLAHRWHHTGIHRGGGKNFGGNFMIFDLLFGTFYMPRGETPDGYGSKGSRVPAGFAGQMLHPFRRRRKRASPGVVA